MQNENTLKFWVKIGVVSISISITAALFGKGYIAIAASIVFATSVWAYKNEV